MRNPEKTSWNYEYFRTCNDGKPMTEADFKKYWKKNGLIGKWDDYYFDIVGKKKPKKDESNEH